MAKQSILRSFQGCKGVKAHGQIFDGDGETADVIILSQLFTDGTGDAFNGKGSSCCLTWCVGPI
jgi:hypothetical protein